MVMVQTSVTANDHKLLEVTSHWLETFVHVNLNVFRQVIMGLSL